jgi:hypothetical protein
MFKFIKTNEYYNTILQFSGQIHGLTNLKKFQGDDENFYDFLFYLKQDVEQAAIDSGNYMIEKDEMYDGSLEYILAEEYTHVLNIIDYAMYNLEKLLF